MAKVKLRHRRFFGTEDPLSHSAGNHSQKTVEAAKERKTPRGWRRALLYRQPSRKKVSSCATVVVSLEGNSKRVSFEERAGTGGMPERKKSSMVIRLPAKSERMATKGTQTDYRESEVQTVVWKHEVKAEGSTLQQLLSLDWLSSENNFPLGMDEVRLIEATRQQLAWDNVTKNLRGPENESRRRSLVQRTTATEAELRKERREVEIGERMERSRCVLREARETFEKKLQSMLLRAYGCRRVENDSKIEDCRHQLTRKIRKMKSASSRPSTRPDIIAFHKDKGSDLYAPKLRDGLNPALGHEVIDIQCRYLKRFHGLEILESHLSRTSHLKLSKSREDFPGAEPRKMELCPRKFKEKVLAEQREEKFDGLSLKIPVPAPTPRCSAPSATKLLSDSEENLQQSSLLLQRLIRGRSVQMGKFAQLFKKTLT